jgi:HEAT repeat protein
MIQNRRFLSICLAAFLFGGCGSEVPAQKAKAIRLLNNSSVDSAQALVTALARRCPNDTGVLTLQIRLFSAERRLLDASSALRRHDSLVGAHDSSLAEIVLSGAMNDGDERTVAGAIEACGELTLEPEYRMVVARLDDRDPQIRSAAVDAVVRYTRDGLASLLAPMMLDNDPLVRAQMLQSAIHLGDTSMLQLTRAMGLLERNDFVIWNYIQMCAVLGQTEMRERVRRELDNKDDVFRTQAAVVLVRLGEKQRLTTVAAGLRSSEAFARSIAAFSLGDLHATGFLDSLVNSSRDSDAAVREAVAYGLGEMGDSRGTATLQEMLADHAPPVRARALSALCRLKQPDIDKLAMRALSDSSRAVRATALAVLLAAGAGAH